MIEIPGDIMPAVPPPAQPKCEHCWHSNGGNAGSYCCRCPDQSIGVFGLKIPWTPSRPDQDHSRKVWPDA